MNKKDIQFERLLKKQKSNRDKEVADFLWLCFDTKLHAMHGYTSEVFDPYQVKFLEHILVTENVLNDSAHPRVPTWISTSDLLKIRKNVKNELAAFIREEVKQQFHQTISHNQAFLNMVLSKRTKLDKSVVCPFESVLEHHLHFMFDQQLARSHILKKMKELHDETFKYYSYLPEEEERKVFEDEFDLTVKQLQDFQPNLGQYSKYEFMSQVKKCFNIFDKELETTLHRAKPYLYNKYLLETLAINQSFSQSVQFIKQFISVSFLKQIWEDFVLEFEVYKEYRYVKYDFSSDEESNDSEHQGLSCKYQFDV
jgi:hypothetical protein